MIIYPSPYGTRRKAARRALVTLLSVAAAVALVTSSTPAVGQPAVNQQADAERRVPAGFTEQRIKVGDISINYVRGGHGPTLVLVHGFPQTWYEWRGILPELARHYTVVAPDLRGAGRSDAPAGGYDKKTMAADIHGLLTKLGLQRDIRLVGHDIGTMVAYSYAAAHPTDVRKLVLSEAPIPDESIYQFPSLTATGPKAWNFGFFSLRNGLPESLVDGREDVWVDLFIDSLEVKKDAIGPVEVREFARYLRDDAHLRASFEWFRAFPTDIQDNAGYALVKLPMPVLAIGASGSLDTFVQEQVQQYAVNVTGAVIADSGHWIYEEHPAELTTRLLTFLS